MFHCSKQCSKVVEQFKALCGLGLRDILSVMFICSKGFDIALLKNYIVDGNTLFIDLPPTV